jgi:hypothetical protein
MPNARRSSILLRTFTLVLNDNHARGESDYGAGVLITRRTMLRKAYRTYIRSSATSFNSARKHACTFDKVKARPKCTIPYNRHHLSTAPSGSLLID